MSKKRKEVQEEHQSTYKAFVWVILTALSLTQGMWRQNVGLFVNTERDACETKQYKSAPVAISAFG
jgi:hypothetical protein